MLTRVEHCLHWVAAIAIAVTTIVVVIEVGLALMGFSTYVGTEFGPFMMAGIVFLTWGTVTRDEDHIRADFFDALFTPGSRAVIRLFLTDTLFVLFAAVLLWVATDLTLNSYQGGERTQGLLRTPVWVPQLAMALGLLVLLLRTLASLIGDAIRFRARREGRNNAP